MDRPLDLGQRIVAAGDHSEDDGLTRFVARVLSSNGIEDRRDSKATFDRSRVKRRGAVHVFPIVEGIQIAERTVVRLRWTTIHHVRRVSWHDRRTLHLEEHAVIKASTIDPTRPSPR